MTGDRGLGAGCRLLALLVLAGGALACLRLAGRGVLAGPALTAPSGWLPWMTGRPPVTAAFALLRLAGLALGWYVLAVTVGGLAARLSAPALRGMRLGRLGSVLVGALDAVTPGGVRAAMEAAVGAGLAATVWAAPAWAGADQGATMQRLPVAVAAPGPPAAVATTWTVGAGESFWIIARRRVEAAGRDQAAPRAEVARYWLHLVAANRARLRHPGNADLIYPGQQLVLPPAPSVP